MDNICKGGVDIELRGKRTSSAGETKFSLSEEPPKHPFDVQVIANTPYKKNVFQDRYFVIESYEQLYNSIPEVKRILAEMVAEHEGKVVTV